MLLAQNKSMILLFYDISFPLLPAEGALGEKKNQNQNLVLLTFSLLPACSIKKT